MFQPSHIVITPLVPSTLSLVSSVVLELLRQKHHFVMLNITVIAPHLSPLTNTTTTTTPPLSPSSSSSSSPSSTENPLDTSPLLPSMALALVAAFNPSSPQNASYYNALEATVQELNAFQEVQVTGELPKEPLITWLVDMNLTSLHFPSYAFLTTSCPPPPSSSLPSFPFSSSSSSMSSTKICYLRPMEWTPGGFHGTPAPAPIAVASPFTTPRMTPTSPPGSTSSSSSPPASSSLTSSIPVHVPDQAVFIQYGLCVEDLIHWPPSLSSRPVYPTTVYMIALFVTSILISKFIYRSTYLITGHALRLPDLPEKTEDEDEEEDDEMRKKDLLARHPHGGAFGSSPSSSSCSTWNFISGRTWDQCQRGFEAQLYEHSSPDFKVYLHTHPPEYTLIDTQEDFLLQCYPVENWEVFPIYDGRWLVGMKMDSLSMDLA